MSSAATRSDNVELTIDEDYVKSYNFTDTKSVDEFCADMLDPSALVAPGDAPADADESVPTETAQDESRGNGNGNGQAKQAEKDNGPPANAGPKNKD